MSYDALTSDYRSQQIERISKALQRLSELRTAPGRVVPETEDLLIGEGRRLRVAILFLDINGFSAWPSETAAEQDQVLAVLNIFFTEMVRIAEDYGGTIEKNTGDGLMAYFEDGGSTPAENGCKRAVASALTMFDTNDALISPLLAQANIAPISFRISIDVGDVTIGRLGAARRFNAAVAVGTAANVSSKMLSFAQGNELVIGDSVRRRLPLLWQVSWTQIINAATGWVYRSTGLRYPFYRYTGRWIRPATRP